MILRDLRDASGVQHLEAVIDAAGGDLVITGQDLGDLVESSFGAGIREYEWTWTVRAKDIPALEKALGTKTNNVLDALARFAHPNVHLLLPFLEQHAIPLERWSRTGD